jgi:predicted transcriptional regulator
MSKTSKQQLLERVARWPDEDLDKLGEAMRAIEAWRSGEYHATEDELREIDAGLAELDRGEIATDEEVRRVLPTLRSQ